VHTYFLLHVLQSILFTTFCRVCQSLVNSFGKFSALQSISLYTRGRTSIQHSGLQQFYGQLTRLCACYLQPNSGLDGLVAAVGFWAVLVCGYYSPARILRNICSAAVCWTLTCTKLHLKLSVTSAVCTTSLSQSYTMPQRRRLLQHCDGAGDESRSWHAGALLPLMHRSVQTPTTQVAQSMGDYWLWCL